MIAEFIGSTGAGKTTLLKSVERRLANSADAITSADLVTALAGFRKIAHPTAQNLIQELVGLPFFASSVYRHRAFVMNTLRCLLRDAGPAVTLFNNVRSLERKVGVYELLKRMAGRRIVLVDEGPVLAAHMFVNAGSHVAATDIRTFTRTVPLPDVLVLVRAPIDTIVGRTLRRNDPPRVLSSRRPADVARYAESAAALFEEVAASLRSALPVLVVDNPDMDEQRGQEVVDTIAAFITGHVRSHNTADPAWFRRPDLRSGTISGRC